MLYSFYCTKQEWLIFQQYAYDLFDYNIWSSFNYNMIFRFLMKNFMYRIPCQSRWSEQWFDHDLVNGCLMECKIVGNAHTNTCMSWIWNKSDQLTENWFSLCSTGNLVYKIPKTEMSMNTYLWCRTICFWNFAEHVWCHHQVQAYNQAWEIQNITKQHIR